MNSPKLPEPITGNIEYEVLNVSMRGDGRQRILKIRHEGKPVVLKCYGRKEKPFRIALRQFGSLFIVGKSSITPKARCKTEHDAINLWRQEGFDVPSLLPIPISDPDLEPCLVMEWIPGTTLARMLLDASIPVSRKQEVIKRFTVILGNRHARARALEEPRLLFENPTFDHVFLSGERLVHHDFEIVFTRRKNIERLVRREIVGFLCSLAKVPAVEFDLLLADFVALYPDHALLRRVQQDLSRYGSVPMLDWVAPFIRLIPRNKRHKRREPITRALDEILDKVPGREAGDSNS